MNEEEFIVEERVVYRDKRGRLVSAKDVNVEIEYHKETLEDIDRKKKKEDDGGNLDVSIKSKR